MGRSQAVGGLLAAVAAIAFSSLGPHADPAGTSAGSGTQSDVGLPEVRFHRVPDGWRQLARPSESSRDGRVIARDYVFWPSSDRLDTHETVSICVSPIGSQECVTPAADVIKRIDLGPTGTAVVRVLPRRPDLSNASDQERWSAMTAEFVLDERS